MQHCAKMQKRVLLFIKHALSDRGLAGISFNEVAVLFDQGLCVWAGLFIAGHDS